MRASSARDPAEAYIRRPEADDWTIERWKTEPRLAGLTLSDTVLDSAAPLWKDLTFAVVIAALLWAVAVIVPR